MINPTIGTAKEARKELGYAEFIKVADGKTIIGKLKYIELKETSFGPSYFVTLTIADEDCVWATKNKVVAATLNEFDKGTEIAITRKGEGTETKYKIVPTSGAISDGLPF